MVLFVLFFVSVIPWYFNVFHDTESYKKYCTVVVPWYMDQMVILWDFEIYNDIEIYVP